jgi:hypothetical protein
MIAWSRSEDSAVGEALQACIKPVDVLLSEDRDHISGIIKYLTQSIWSRTALFVSSTTEKRIGKTHDFDGVQFRWQNDLRSVVEMFTIPTRKCRPIGLSPHDCETICKYTVERIDLRCDFKILADLARYMVPLSVP